MTDRLSTFPSHQRKVLNPKATSSRRIMHIDMDAYFAALEQKANPKLAGKPVVVGSTSAKRGVVSTASYESRVFGIHSGMPSAEARRLCPHAVFIGVDPDHYISVSAELGRIFNEFSPRVEAVSVDEAFLDVTGCDEVFGSEEALARGLKARIRSALSLTCSIGIAPSKIMAKLASSVFKPDGLTILHYNDVESILYPLPVEKMWGIGPVSAQALNQMGICTIGDLANHDLRRLRRIMGQNGEVMGRIARGDDHSPVISPEEQPDEKSIGHERTLPKDSADPDYLHATLHYLADLVSRRMRNNGFCGKTITVRIRHADFTTFTRRTTLKHASDSQKTIYRYAEELFDRNWTTGVKIRLLGISVSNLENADQSGEQHDLFHAEQESLSMSRRSVDELIDRIRDRFGEDSIRSAYSYLGISE
jgi:nucleotidyltransferase/DNA polymerase involved in DNA repair